MKYPIIIRQDKEGGLIAFFPGASANYGYIQCFSRDGCHDEASIDYYWETKTVKKETEKEFLEWYQAWSDSLPGDKEKFFLMHRLSYKLMQKAWKRSY